MSMAAIIVAVLSFVLAALLALMMISKWENGSICLLPPLLSLRHCWRLW
jgi:hypothetical protein